MKYIIYLTTALVILLSVPHDAPAQDQSLSADQIMDKVDKLKEPKDLTADMTMILINKKGKERKRKVRTIRQGRDKQIMWFLEPADVKGTGFMRIEKEGDFDDMRLYLPAFKKTRRITSSAKGDNFMGSDLTYEDMTTRKLEDYKYELQGEETVDEKPCYKVKCTPVSKGKSEYGHIISWVWKDEWIPVKEEFYDKKAKLLKNKLLLDFKPLKSYQIFGTMKVENVQKKHSTVLNMDNISVDEGVKSGLFHERNLKRIPR
ncbi:outer membrane lipoprotein-sorting protein [Fibrobacterota bacterium]